MSFEQELRDTFAKRLHEVLTGKLKGASSRVYGHDNGDGLGDWEPFHLCRALWYIKSGELIAPSGEPIGPTNEIRIDWHRHGQLGEMHDFARHMMFTRWQTTERLAKFHEVRDGLNYAYSPNHRLIRGTPGADWNTVHELKIWLTDVMGLPRPKQVRKMLDRAFWVDETHQVSFGQTLVRRDGRIYLRELAEGEHWSNGCITNRGVIAMVDFMLTQEQRLFGRLKGQSELEALNNPQPAPDTKTATAIEVAPASRPSGYKRTGWFDVADTYVVALYKEHGPMTCKALERLLMEKAVDDESPFKVVRGELALKSSGNFVKSKTLENAFIEIKLLAGK
jgi:hypothetical protein